jgi:pimeloyl-ACP methyl ester carboxylesterase
MIVVIVICFVAGCARKPILVVTVGGLGYSQMGDVRRAIDRRCPKAKVISAGWWDAYKSDLPRIIRKSPHDHLVLIGHSFGCQTVAQAARKVSKVDLVVFIDPAWNDIRLPRNVERCLWYRRSDFGWARKAKVIGASAATIRGGHNDIPESKELIAGVVKAINEIRVRAR